jgi:hypothetical protein
MMKCKKPSALVCLIGNIGVSACPMVEFTGFYENHGPPSLSLGDVRSIVPLHRDGIKTAIKVGTYYIFVLFAVTVVAAGVIWSK